MPLYNLFALGVIHDFIKIVVHNGYVAVNLNPYGLEFIDKNLCCLKNVGDPFTA